MNTHTSTLPSHQTTNYNTHGMSSKALNTLYKTIHPTTTQATATITPASTTTTTTTQATATITPASTTTTTPTTKTTIITTPTTTTKKQNTRKTVENTILPKAYVKCADENAQCNFTGTKSVAFSSTNNNVYYKTLTDGTLCSTTVFGDPDTTATKSCYIADVPTVTFDASNNPTGYTLCSNENNFCYPGGRLNSSYSLNSTSGYPINVIYTANGKYSYISTSSPVYCSSTILGDPSPGSTKKCYWKINSLPTSNTTTIDSTNTTTTTPVTTTTSTTQNSANVTQPVAASASSGLSKKAIIAIICLCIFLIIVVIIIYFVFRKK